MFCVIKTNFRAFINFFHCKDTTESNAYLRYKYTYKHAVLQSFIWAVTVLRPIWCRNIKTSRFCGLMLLFSSVDPLSKISLDLSPNPATTLSIYLRLSVSISVSLQRTDFSCVYTGVNFSYFRIFGRIFNGNIQWK